MLKPYTYYSLVGSQNDLITLDERACRSRRNIMVLLIVIRRWAIREGISIREISRRLGLSRNKVRRYLRSGAVAPEFKIPERSSSLDPFADKLSLWLKSKSGKSGKQRRTAKQLHADLASLGYD